MMYWLKIFVCLALVGMAYLGARIPNLSPDQKVELAKQFQFESQVLPNLVNEKHGDCRPVEQHLQHISNWVAAVGASVTLCDLDGNGLSNDAIYIDTCSDSVVVAAVGSAAETYTPFLLYQSPSDAVAPMGCLPGDFNEDGYTDVMVYFAGVPATLFLRNPNYELSSKSFIRQQLGEKNTDWFTNAATQADLDGDGHLDLIIGNYFQDGAKVLDAASSGTTQMHASFSNAFNGGSNRIFLWKSASQNSVNYEDVSDSLPTDVAKAWTLAIGAADLDGDLLPEIYFANDFGPDRLLHNRSTPGKLIFQVVEGTRNWDTPRSKVLGQDSFKGMGVDFADINQDGWLDIYISNITCERIFEESHLLFVSTGEVEKFHDGVAPYVEQSEQFGVARSGWGWDAKFADLNNDGSLELLQATGFFRGEYSRWPELHELSMGNDQLISNTYFWPNFGPNDDICGHEANVCFTKGKDGVFYNVAMEMGIGSTIPARGIAVSDVDHDGDLDFAVGNQWEPNTFYTNQSPKQGEFIGLRIGFSKNNRFIPAVGATVTLQPLDTTKRNCSPMVAQIDGGNGHSGCRSAELHFGLGNVPKKSFVSVEIKWRNSTGSVNSSRVVRQVGEWHTIFLNEIPTNNQVTKR